MDLFRLMYYGNLSLIPYWRQHFVPRHVLCLSTPLGGHFLSLSLYLFIYLFFDFQFPSLTSLGCGPAGSVFFCLVFRFCCCCWVAVHALIMWTFSFVRCWWCAATVDCVHFTPGTCFVFLMISLLHTCYLCCMPCCIINRNRYLYGMAECLPAVFITGNGSVCCRISDL